MQWVNKAKETFIFFVLCTRRRKKTARKQRGANVVVSTVLQEQKVEHDWQDVVERSVFQKLQQTIVAQQQHQRPKKSTLGMNSEQATRKLPISSPKRNPAAKARAKKQAVTTLYGSKYLTNLVLGIWFVLLCHRDLSEWEIKCHFGQFLSWCL
jgi:hypothetical protein